MALNITGFRQKKRELRGDRHNCCGTGSDYRMSEIPGESRNSMAGFGTVVQPAARGRYRAYVLGRFGATFFQRALLVTLSVSFVGGLLWFSLYLAASRIYQVDECCNVFTAYSLAAGHPRVGLEFFQLLLSHAFTDLHSSVGLLTAGRRVMVVVFWLNWLFLALATGERVLSVRWWVALLGAATLAPLWDYGFEIRHDNLLLLGLLVIWATVRFSPPCLLSYFFVGIVVCGVQFAATKAIVYTAPLSLAILVFPPPGRTAPRWKLALAWLLGVLLMLLAVNLIFGRAGGMGDYLVAAQATVSVSAGSTRHRYFWPTLEFTRLVKEAPLITALATAAVVAVAVRVWRNWRSVLSWDGLLPEVLLFGVALNALLINPTPFLYNLVNVVPFAFLLAYRYASQLLKKIGDRPDLVPVVVSVLVFTHFVPFAFTTRRHLDWPNVRQEHLIWLSEALTDPVKDPVFDAVGMVPTRPLVSDWAFLHSTEFGRSTPPPEMRGMLATNPPAVIIRNYRFDWLSGADREFLRKRYVALADDFWVLGSVLPSGGGHFKVIHPGRYRISLRKDSNLEGTYPEGLKALMIVTNQPALRGTIDGKPLTGEPVDLEVGVHQLKCRSPGRLAVVWVGPKMDRLPRLGRGDHHTLFANGY